MDLEVKIVNWLKKKLKQAKAKGLILGLSGGVDSAVVSVLAKKAVGKNHFCLIMPINSHKEHEDDAMLVAKKFNLNIKKIDLTEVYKKIISIFPKANKLTCANLMPRLRMITLYYFANKLDYLVVGTGNKTELTVGYFTKYGDGGVDILPIGDLLKKQVRDLAKKIGIPEKIISKPPTAGLWEGQTDEGEMGITYNELDEIIYNLGCNKKQSSPKELVKKIKHKVKRSEHKRMLAEICK